MRRTQNFKAAARIVAVIDLTRLHNSLLAGGCVVLGGFLSSGGASAGRLWFAAAIVALFLAVATVVNDCVDIETDRVNKPSRPLPAGRVSLKQAWTLALTLEVSGIAGGLALGGSMAAMTIAYAALGVAYSLVAKGMGLLADVTVSMLIASTVIFGGMAVGEIEPTILPALVIFVFMLCREILKDVEDYEGDRFVGTRTVAVAWGRSRALQAFYVGAICAVIVSILPWLTGAVSARYLIVTLPAVDAVLLVSAYLLSRSTSHCTIRLTLEATKLIALVWIVAMFFGAR